MSKYPVLRGTVKEVQDGKGTIEIIEVWCPYCEQYHTHGWPSGSKSTRKKEHRVAHCTVDSPYKDSGYMIGVLP
jgi:hypothetical protein